MTIGSSLHDNTKKKLHLLNMIKVSKIILDYTSRENILILKKKLLTLMLVGLSWHGSSVGFVLKEENNFAWPAIYYKYWGYSFVFSQ